MQCILFIGIPASGKSSFYKEHFFNSHVRVSLDLLNTRNKEQKLIAYCFATQSKFVIDNTNVSQEERAKYITLLKDNRYEIIGYYFETTLEDALNRNENRNETISAIGVKAKYKQLELPTITEGFDKIFKVNLINKQFKVENYEV